MPLDVRPLVTTGSGAGCARSRGCRNHSVPRQSERIRAAQNSSGFQAGLSLIGAVPAEWRLGGVRGLARNVRRLIRNMRTTSAVPIVVASRREVSSLRSCRGQDMARRIRQAWRIRQTQTAAGFLPAAKDQCAHGWCEVRINEQCQRMLAPHVVSRCCHQVLLPAVHLQDHPQVPLHDLPPGSSPDAGRQGGAGRAGQHLEMPVTRSRLPSKVGSSLMLETRSSMPASPSLAA